jgi:flagellin
VSFSVNTNTNALAALESLALTQQSLTTTQQRVSSGLKVGGAADDASTFAIAQGQRGDIAGFQQVSSSLSLGSATVAVALQGTTSISNTLNQLEAKVVQGLSSSASSLPSIQNDINSFIAQINSTAAAAQFNGVNLINDVNAGTATAANESVLSSLNRAGASLTTASITVASQNLTSTGLGVSGVNIGGTAVTLAFTPTAVFANHDTLQLTTYDKTGAPSGGGAGTPVTTTFEFIDAASAATTAPTNANNIVIQTDNTKSLGQNLSIISAALAKQGFSSSFDSSGNLAITAANGFRTNAAGAQFAATDNVLTLASGLATGTATETTGNASSALQSVETAITSIQAALSAFGTASNKLTSQSTFIKTLTDTLTTGVGQLVDADLAAESANLQALQTKQSLGIQALSIANQGPGAVLTLFR